MSLTDRPFDRPIERRVYSRRETDRFKDERERKMRRDFWALKLEQENGG